jgi:molybdopterin biosynthesis enzyme MoaB
VTPEATRDVVAMEIPGFGERMRAVSLTKSSHAIVSRALAGTRAGTLIINLPGSPRAALENLEAVWPAVPHLIAKLQGDPEDCGTP